MNDLTLSLDFSHTSPSMALIRMGQEVQILRETQISRHTLESFVPSLDGLLKKEGVSFEELTSFITTSGPGSFTGLRCCYASLKAFSKVTQRPIITVAGDEIRALKFFEENEFTTVYVATSMGAQRAVLSMFSRHESKKIERTLVEKLESPMKFPILLADPKVLDLTPSSPNVFFVPLSASLVARLCHLAQSRTVASTPEQINALEPDYYGDRWALAKQT